MFMHKERVNARAKGNVKTKDVSYRAKVNEDFLYRRKEEFLFSKVLLAIVSKSGCFG